MMSKSLAFITVSVLITVSTGYRILVLFPTPSYSHQRPQMALSQALGRQGHEVTVISPNLLESESHNIKQVNITFLYKKYESIFRRLATENPEAEEMFNIFNEVGSTMFDDVFNNEGVQKLLNDKSQKFDAVIVESLGYIATHALAEKYNATLIGLSSMEMQPYAHTAMGNPSHYLLHSPVNFNHPKNPTILQKIKIIFENYMYITFFKNFFKISEAVIERHIPENKLSIKELINRFDLSIECTSPVLGFVRPILPNTKQIGFLHIEEPKPLPKDLKDYLDSSRAGVIYVSFGSNVKSIQLGNDLMNIFQTALGSLPYDILWKYENNSMPNQPKNVKTAIWTPQLDLLAHPKVKLFITQAGFQSLEETVARGVPALGIPFFGDQMFNARHLERIGIGRRLLKEEITVDLLKNAILEVIENGNYKERAVQLGNQVRDSPMNATETAVWYIEHAIRNRGSPMFKYKGRDMSFYEYYFLDVGCFLLFCTFLIAVALFEVLALCKQKFKTIKPKNE